MSSMAVMSRRLARAKASAVAGPWAPDSPATIRPSRTPRPAGVTPITSPATYEVTNHSASLSPASLPGTNQRQVNENETPSASQTPA